MHSNCHLLVEDEDTINDKNDEILKRTEISKDIISAMG
jgi:hypothetical protein